MPKIEIKSSLNYFSKSILQLSFKALKSSQILSEQSLFSFFLHRFLSILLKLHIKVLNKNIASFLFMVVGSYKFREKAFKQTLKTDLNLTCLDSQQG